MVNKNTATLICMVVGAVLAVASLVMAAVAYSMRDRPVLSTLGNNVLDCHGSQILNPFRDMGPEVAAVAFLDELRSGKCSTVLEKIGGRGEQLSYICGKELEHPIVSWRLAARGLDKGRVLLRFDVTRVYGEKRDGAPYWFWVTQQDGKHWEVVSCDRWY